MNLNDIDYLVAVAEHRHVGRAAEALGLTQSALTRALARLEALAGLPLFERHPKGVMPTEAGLAFLRRARRIQLEYDDTLSELHQMKTGELGILRIGYSPSVDVERLMQVVRRLLMERPAARIHLSERLMHYLMADLDAGEVDAVVAPLPHPMPDPLEALRLSDDELQVMADTAHPLRRRKSLDIAAIAAEPWLLPPPDTRLRRELERLVQQSGLPPLTVRIEAAATNLNTMRLLCGTPLLTLSSSWSLPPLAAIGLKPLPIALPALRRKIGWITRRHGHRSPLLERMQQLLVEEFGLRGAAKRRVV
ncbi:LysR family transcriptional regulator [Roseateles chitosanitabidus]|uniref:LysR family transcriptional regulator n=1 Tax=Roseateles chitosanitabidus TaxID=65048 RepID=UPI00082E349C|nr:LysR family transcriptional regulator [Roseateles chitosanitabidus]